MNKAEQFFYEHAGYSFDPKTETQEQGKLRCAKELAEAERIAANLEWRFEWVDDWMGSHDWKEYSGEPATCEQCTVYDPSSNRVLASLSCIDDADNNYRRVIEAELAAEALYDYDREIEILDAH